MRAVVRDRYGSADVLELTEIEKPGLEADRVLVRVRATSVNPADWYAMSGLPYLARPTVGLRRPRSRLLGTDYAGTVEAVGSDVTDFAPGDEVFGARTGAFAEYVDASSIAHKPAGLSFDEAAAVPVAALTALQGLRDKGRVQPGEHVLINGASGGVGTFAVQIAKALGANVTGVCSTGNVDRARELGADHVVDYTTDDFTTTGKRYDVILDVAGSRSWSDCKRVLDPGGRLVVVGAAKGGRTAGPLGHIAKLWLGGLASRRKVVFFIAKFDQSDLTTLCELLESGAVKPVIDRRYQLSEIGDALRYLGEGHARGKVVVTI